MKKKYIVNLSDSERELLRDCVETGKTEAYRIRHAHILLKADAEGPGWPDARISEAFGCHARTVYNVRRRFVEKGISDALGRRERQEPPCPRKLDGAAEARLIALSCGQPPEGLRSWTLRLLASELVRLEIVESISPETVRQTLKKCVETASSGAVGDSTG